MAKSVQKYVVHVFLALGALMLITGCVTTTTQGLPLDLSTASTELASFMQQFAREALAAFLL